MAGTLRRMPMVEDIADPPGDLVERLRGRAVSIPF
jgi:hypothetical protein